MAKAMQSGDMFLLTNISSRDNFIEKDSNGKVDDQDPDQSVVRASGYNLSDNTSGHSWVQLIIMGMVTVTIVVIQCP